MYSVVLMVAMTGGADVPAGFFGHGCCGGDCYGYSCHGYSCHGYSCHGYSCHGCWGGHTHYSCHGCCGGYAYSCHGCHGWSCHGCCGGYAYSCHGCCGGWSCHGCCGGGWFGHHRHHECCYEECCPTVYYGCCGGYQAAPAAPAGEKIESKPMEKKTTELDSAAPATLVVTLPADAKLLIDDAATISSSARRVFVSPALQAGREYTYSLKAEFTKNGKTVVVSKDINVTAGAEIAVTMEETLAGVASR
jgi:uncharacterized protein (TIGR03000 family)